MKCQTEHLYLKIYPINPKHTKLIVGTIHPEKTSLFITPFFYGNRNSIWNIFRDAFPNEFKTLSPAPITLEEILSFLNNRGISMSDTIVSCSRVADSAQDKDLTELTLNTALVEQIRNSQIDHVYFTSGFGKNSAFQLFYQKILKKTVSSEMRSKREFLDESTFGRPVRYSLLWSPSGSAMRSIVRSEAYRKVQNLYSQEPHPVKAFRVDEYRKAFSK